MTNSKEIFNVRSYCVEESVGYLLSRARTKLAKSVDCQLASHDITHAQGSIIMMLSSGKYVTAAALARELYVDSASMTRMLDRLEKRSLIERVRCGEDRRVSNLRLTPDGQKLANQLPDVFTSVLNRNFAAFTADEVANLKALLRKLLDTQVPEENKAK